jgi:hypothetical protein
MFVAILIICAPLLGESCVEIVDFKASDKHAECVQRAVQIFHSTQMILPPPYRSVSYKCRDDYKVKK